MIPDSDGADELGSLSTNYNGIVNLLLISYQETVHYIHRLLMILMLTAGSDYLLIRKQSIWINGNAGFWWWHEIVFVSHPDSTARPRVPPPLLLYSFSPPLVRQKNESGNHCFDERERHFLGGWKDIYGARRKELKKRRFQKANGETGERTWRTRVRE